MLTKKDKEWILEKIHDSSCKNRERAIQDWGELVDLVYSLAEYLGIEIKSEVKGCSCGEPHFVYSFERRKTNKEDKNGRTRKH